MKNFIDFVKTKKILVILSLAMLLVSLGTFLVVHHYSEESVTAEVKLTTTEKNLSQLLEKTKACFYDPAKQDYLATGLTVQKVAELQRTCRRLNSEVDHFRNQKDLPEHYKKEFKKLSDIEDLQQEVMERLKTQNSINNLFVSSIIDGNLIAQNIAVIYNLKEKNIERIQLKSFSKDPWTISMTKLLVQAKRQLRILQRAKSLVDLAVKTKTKKDFDHAHNVVDQVLNQKHQEELNKRLSEIEQIKEESSSSTSTSHRKEEAKKTTESSSSTTMSTNTKAGEVDPKESSTSDYFSTSSTWVATNGEADEHSDEENSDDSRSKSPASPTADNATDINQDQSASVEQVDSEVGRSTSSSAN